MYYFGVWYIRHDGGIDLEEGRGCDDLGLIDETGMGLRDLNIVVRVCPCSIYHSLWF